MGALTLVAGAPVRPKVVARAWETTEQDDTLIWGMSSAYLMGEYAYRLARWLREWLEEERGKADRLHVKVFDRPDLAGHPKWGEAKARLDDLEQTLLREGARASELEAVAAARRGSLVQMWSRLSPAAAAVIEGAWTTGARTPEEFARWVDGAWEAERRAATTGVLECPF